MVGLAEEDNLLVEAAATNFAAQTAALVTELVRLLLR